MYSVIVEEGVTSLGRHAFADLEGLVSITLPSTLGYINELAFYSAGNLRTVICNRQTPPVIEAAAFQDADTSNITAIVPPGSVSAYASAPVWKDFDIITSNADASLRSLTVNNLTLSPPFNKDILNYSDTVSNAVSGISVAAVSRNPFATVTGTGNYPLFHLNLILLLSVIRFLSRIPYPVSPQMGKQVILRLL
ncbi:MAG: leucine-rich repeat protein [Dysgonamonadaceae bacterium]|nr:leucine-rich repeat protein [Dysgonamonadaceae bacterium]